MSTPGAGSGGPSKINKYLAEKPTYEESMAAHKKMLQELTAIAGVEVTSLEDFKIKLLQKRLNTNIVDAFKKLPPRFQKPLLDSLRKDIFSKWGPRGPRTNGEVGYFKDLYGGFKEVLTDEYYKSLLTRIEIEVLEKQIEAIKANALLKNPASSAKGMAAYNAKIRANIKRAQNNAARKEYENYKEVQAFLAEQNAANAAARKKENEEIMRQFLSGELNDLFTKTGTQTQTRKQGGKRRRQTKRRQTRRRV